jgi:hypothetical protein
MGLVGEDEIDLHGPAQHQHPAPVEAQAIPLLREWLEWREQVGQRFGDRGEIARVDAEIPVGELRGTSVRPRADEPDFEDRGVSADEGDDPLRQPSR